MSKVIHLFNIPIDAITMQETLEKFERSVFEKKQIHHTVVNAGKIILMQTDKQLLNSVLEADIINADGQAVVWAANLFGLSIPERVAGIDLMQKLVELSHINNYKCYFFGAKEKVVQKLVSVYKKKYSEKIIAGFRNGYFRRRGRIYCKENFRKWG